MSGILQDRSAPAPFANVVTRLRDGEGAPITRDAIERLRRPGTDPRGTMVTTRPNRRVATVTPRADRLARRRKRDGRRRQIRRLDPTIRDLQQKSVDALYREQRRIMDEVRALARELAVVKEAITAVEAAPIGGSRE